MGFFRDIFKASDFRVAGNLISLNYADGQKASSTQPGFLSATDWSTFNAGVGGGTVTSVSITAPAAGITQSGSPITTSGSITLALADDLAAVEALVTTGIVRRTGVSTWSAGTAVSLTAEVTGVLPVANYATGTPTGSKFVRDDGVLAVPTGTFSSPLTTKGDVFVYSTGDTRLPIGTDAFVLTADSTQATGMKWAATGAAGSVRLDQILAGTADSTLTTTGTVTINSGDGASGAIGKPLTIQAGAGGAGGASPFAGGLIAIQGGTGSATTNAGTGGVVSITGGTGGAGTNTGIGGAVNILGGTGGGGTNSAGGAITLTAGPSASAATGAAVNINGGLTGSGGTAGAVNITSGVGGACGAVNITGADGAGSNSSGGSILLTAGTSTNSVSAGHITITGGGGFTGGAVTLQGGAAQASAGAVGGGISVIAAAGSGTSTGGAGGSVAITAGNAGGSAANAGGDITLKTGTATSTGKPGNVVLNGTGSALATTAIGGFTCLPTCAGTPTGTPASIPTGTVPFVFDTSGIKLWIFTGGAWKGVVVA